MIDLAATTRKQHWNRSAVYGLLAVALVFVCVSPVDSFTQNDAVDCSGLRACTKCTKNPSCNWSLKRQTCENTTQNPELLMVDNLEHCPKFTVVDSFVHLAHLPFTYKVKVSNDVSGFVKYLNNTDITCSFRGVTYNGLVNEAKDTINCAPITNDSLQFDEQRLMMYHYSVAFDGVPLQFDDHVNNYFAVYNNNSNCDGTNKTKQCVECSWDSKLDTYYYKRCSAGNECTGPFEYYDRQSVNDDADAAADDLADLLTPDAQSDDNTTLLTEFGPPVGACPSMTIQSVSPLSAPWCGGATLLITVKNHEVLAELREVAVTVAGRDCVDPETVNNETISCTVGPPRPDDSSRFAGPVNVTYGRLRLTSFQIFRFVDPKPTDLSPTCGPITGRTLLRITGSSLDSGSTASVYVGPDNLPCELVARYEDYILCKTRPSERPATGDVIVVFDDCPGQTVGANSTADAATGPPSKSPQFTYVENPMLEAGQPFSGIASGGTFIPVRGRHLSCVRYPVLYVDNPKGVRQYATCVVRNDTFMRCRAPGIVAPRPPPKADIGFVQLLNFGIRVYFADHRMDLTPPGFPGYRLYADPVFTDFETDGGVNVTVNGRHMDRGYPSSTDLAIRLRNSTGPLCAVVDIQRRRIVCQRPSPWTADDDLRELYITVGHEFVRTVKKRNSDNTRGSSFGVVLRVFLMIVGIPFGVCFLSLLATAVYLLCYKRYSIRRFC